MFYSLIGIIKAHILEDILAFILGFLLGIIIESIAFIFARIVKFYYQKQ